MGFTRTYQVPYFISRLRNYLTTFFFTTYTLQTMKRTKLLMTFMQFCIARQLAEKYYCSVILGQLATNAATDGMFEVFIDYEQEFNLFYLGTATALEMIQQHVVPSY